MTSMFDQFNEPSQNLRSGSDIISAAEMSTLGYIQMKVEPDVPIFQKIKKNFTSTDKVTHAAVSNKYMVVAMANASGTLLRINLSNSNQDEISLSKYTTGRLANIFLDPTGNHLLLTFAHRNAKEGPELLYLSRKSTKLKSTTKFRGHEFTEIGWNHANDSATTTGPILLGTSKGLIFETEIALDGDKFFTSGFSSSLEQYWRQLPNYLPLYGSREVDGLVFDIGKGANTPITGIEFFRANSTEKYIIFVTTPNRLYYFGGKVNGEEKPLLQQVFNRYLNVSEEETFFEVDGKFSRIKFWGEKVADAPKSFAWMTGSGILFGNIDSVLSDESKNVKHIIKQSTEIIPYPKPLYEESQVATKLPFNFVLTEFHVLLAYTDMIKGLSLLNRELIYEDNYNEAFGKLINIIKDTVTGSIWAVTESQLFKFIVTREERYVWQFYCDKEQFDLAKKYSQDNEVHFNQVLIKEADVLFNTGQYLLSAQRYAETQCSFEDISLKFIKVGNLDALSVFLCKKLSTLKPQDSTQTTMIVLWVVELHLNQLEEMRLQGKEQMPAYFDLQKKFESFLTTQQVSDCIKKNKSTIYDLMASHGDRKNLMKLTIVNKDFEQLIRQHIYSNDFHEALNVLKGQNNRELFYQFTPILIREVPSHTVNALVEQGRNLMPIRLLPALVTCEKEAQSGEVIRYLEFAIEKLKSTEKAIHNLLLTLYAKHDEAKLMTYLNSQGQDMLMINYDIYFALRLCQERKLIKACVHLFALLGLWESAVDLALTIDVQRAKDMANLPPQTDVELRKKLWLKIAQHIISSSKDDIKKAMEFLQECDLLRIEDILPYFSDFVTIDHFRDAICNSLKEYNQHIQDLKDEMDEATKSAELVRKEIQSFRNRYACINNTDACDICELTLMVRPFYMFPCRHRFHGDCLMKELSPLLGPARKNKLADLHRQLNILSTQCTDNVSTGSSGLSVRDTVKAEIDNIVASECLYCGENMIRNIDMPFVDDTDYERILKEWE